MRFIFAIVAVVCAVAALAVAEAPTQSPKDSAMLKAVIHVNFDDAERQHNALGNIENILKSEPKAELEVICHGPGIGLVQKSKAKHAEQVQALMQQGVRFEACENTMKKKSIPQDDLLAGTTTVPSGAVEIIRKQQQGYSYFRP